MGSGLSAKDRVGMSENTDRWTSAFVGFGLFGFVDSKKNMG